MPNRMFSDRAWKSDKLAAVQPDEFRAEYAWIYSIALCDGTFECDPKKVWAECYAAVRQTDGRGAWTVKRVGELLDELTRRGLLLRETDENGKQWGYWTGCEENLPQLSHRHKFKQGKKILFKVDAKGMPLVSQKNANGIQGLGLGFGDGVGDGVEADRDGSSRPSAAGDVLDEIESEREGTIEGTGRAAGVPGYFRRGQYPGTSPKQVWRHCAAAWMRIRGDGAYCPFPTKHPQAKTDAWADLCDVTSGDLIVPAFELWTDKEGKHMKTQYPLSEFMRSGNAQKYLALISPLNEVKPKVTDEDVKRVYEMGRAAHAEQWGLDPVTMKPKEEVSNEPGAEAFLEE